jgi:hypothetical protein
MNSYKNSTKGWASWSWSEIAVFAAILLVVLVTAVVSYTGRAAPPTDQDQAQLVNMKAIEDLAAKCKGESTLAMKLEDYKFTVQASCSTDRRIFK